MRWFCALTIALILTCATSAHAQDQCNCQQSVVVYPTRTVRVAPRSRNVFSQLWELEKRKNAWLKRTFLRF